VIAMVGAYPIFGSDQPCPSFLHEFFQPDFCVPAPPAA